MPASSRCKASVPAVSRGAITTKVWRICHDIVARRPLWGKRPDLVLGVPIALWACLLVSKRWIWITGPRGNIVILKVWRVWAVLHWLGFLSLKECHSVSCAKLDLCFSTHMPQSFGSHCISFCLPGTHWFFLLCCRFGGNTWSWMKATEWRITTANWLRSWTHTMSPPEGFFWLGRHYRISSQNSGPSSTSSSLPSSRVAAHSSSGLMLHLPWLAKGYWSNVCVCVCVRTRVHTHAHVHSRKSLCVYMFVYVSLCVFSTAWWWIEGRGHKTWNVRARETSQDGL